MTEPSRRKKSVEESEAGGVPQQVGPSFDRIKPQAKATDAPTPNVTPREDDHQGKRALFSDAVQPPSVGSVALACSGCNSRSVVSYVRLAKMSVTGFHLPVPGMGYRAWLKCPACERHTWVTVSIRA